MQICQVHRQPLYEKVTIDLHCKQYLHASINQSINLLVEPAGYKQAEKRQSQWNNKTYKAHKEH